MKIYVFKRGDTEGADFALPDGAKVIRTIDLRSTADVDKHLKKETGRIAALIERARGELQKPESPASIKERSFFGRAKWLFTGN